MYLKKRGNFPLKDFVGDGDLLLQEAGGENQGPLQGAHRIIGPGSLPGDHFHPKAYHQSTSPVHTPELPITLPVSLTSRTHCCICKMGDNIYLYLFSIAAVTKYHKFGGLKWHKFVILQFWRSESQNGLDRVKIRLSAGPPFLQRLKGKICFLAFPASRGCPYSLVHGNFLLPDSSMAPSNLDSDPLLPLSHTLFCLPLINIPVITLGSPW